jgi:hypothetical protein
MSNYVTQNCRQDPDNDLHLGPMPIFTIKMGKGSWAKADAYSILWAHNECILLLDRLLSLRIPSRTLNIAARNKRKEMRALIDFLTVHNWCTKKMQTNNWNLLERHELSYERAWSIACKNWSWLKLEDSLGWDFNLRTSF